MALALAGCAGDTGPAGEQGEKGDPGGAGADGKSALVKTSAEAAGSNCANGGVKIEAGTDENDNGVLDSDEVNTALTSYACNGGSGTSPVQTLIKTSDEAAGVNCDYGGTKIEVGPDSNANGTLDTAEVVATLTRFACNGEPGADALATLVKTSAEDPGNHCADGGTKVEVGSDTNANGALDAGEVNAALTTYVCNGGQGDPGVQTLVKTSPEARGTHCAFGGTKIEVGSDADANGVLDAAEVDAALTTYACNGQAGPASVSTGLVVTITDVSTTDPVRVHFTMKDDRGYPVDRTGFYSVNTAFAPRFSLSYITVDANGVVSPYNVYSKSNSTSAPAVFQPTFYNPDPSSSGTTKTPAVGTLVEDAPGTGAYTYTFPATDVAQTKTDGTPNGVLYKAVTFDANHLNDTHVVWIQATRQTDLVNTNNAKTFTADDVSYSFVPSGVGTPVKREIVKSENCANCHRDFKPESLVSNEFHSGARNNPQMCNVCHNPARTSNPAADSKVFVHRIHYGEHIRPTSQFHSITATFPQDIRSCSTCHGGAAQGVQALTKPSQAACGSCHETVDFASTSGTTCQHPPTLDGNGDPVACRHTPGPKTDAECVGCHVSDGTIFTKAQHVPVVPPDPNSTYAGGTNSNTNAAYLAASGFVPIGADVITYVVDSVSLVDANPVSAAYKNPQIKFKFKRNGSDVVFPTFAAGTTVELMNGFVGSPSAYFAWAEPQDHIDTPANFNVSASAYIKGVWNGSVAATAATLSSTTDGNGFYTLVLTGTKVPTNATMLTGGIGYSYSLATTQPLTQVTAPGYSYDTGTKIGGLSVPPPNVWKTAVGFTARRTIVDNNNCLKCHGALGVAPTFHAGQRNDAPTCSFCHTPNRTSSGWSADVAHYVHAIHSGRMRYEFFDWHATEEGPGFGDVEFPSQLNDCKACHVAGAYDISSAAADAALPNRTVSTVATGRFTNDKVANPTAWFAISPYVDASYKTDYGFGYSTSDITYKYPDGLGGTQTVGADTVTCTPEAPCLCSATNPCTQTSTSGKQGSTVCSVGSPCTCTTASTCTVTVRSCTNLAPCEADGTTLVNTPLVQVCSGCHDEPVAIDHMETNGGAFYRPRSQVLRPDAPKEQCLVCHGPGEIVSIESVHE
ncbi:MAG: OmcA/MtrC family decaheme c-type cytochrome [Myxococcota bacterium]